MAARAFVGLSLAGLLVAALVAAGQLAVAPPVTVTVPPVADLLGDLVAETGTSSLVAESLKLLGAALIGVLVTFVQRVSRRAAPLSRSMEHAQVLLAVAGALTMTLIGNSLPRAFGIAGAASIIRFRTPVEDPRDATILFLLMGLGMAAGLGLTGVAIAGTLFLCGCLLVLKQEPSVKKRTMSVLLVADAAEFPSVDVQRVFDDHHVTVEPIEVTRDSHAAVRYRATLAPTTSLERLNDALAGGGIKSIVWQASKKDL